MHPQRVNNLTPTELEQIVKLHQKLLSESFLNKLGVRFIKTFYSASVKDNQNLFYLIKDQQVVIGFLLGTFNNQQFIKKTFFRSPFKLSWELVNTTLTKPQDFINLLISSLKISDQKPQAELQFIAVDVLYQGKGFGRKLIDKFKEDLKKQKVNQFIVGTQKNNLESNNFYKKIGYTEISQKKIFGQVITFYQSSI